MKITLSVVGVRTRSAVVAVVLGLVPACSTPRPYTATDADIDADAGGGVFGHAGVSGSGGDARATGGVPALGTGGAHPTGGVPGLGTGGSAGTTGEAGHAGTGGGVGSGGTQAGSGGVAMNPGGGPGSGGASSGGMIGSGGTNAGSGSGGGTAIGTGGSLTAGGGHPSASGGVQGSGGTRGSGGVSGSGGVTGTGGSSCSDTNACPTGKYCANGSCLPQVTNGTSCQTMAQCQSGNCSGNLCCAAGLTNCSGTCIDLTSNDKHCGACTGPTVDCTMSGQALEHCRNSACRLVDGSPCTSDSDCMSGQCNLYYADYDKDGYPDHYNTQRFCTIPGQLSDGPNTTIFMSPRTDGKWDCCDQYSAAHPDATAFGGWQISEILSQQCMAAFGDTNCNGQVEVDPSAIITTGCNSPDGVSCNKMTRTPAAADCGMSLCGCGAPSVGGFCSLYCAPGGPVVSCR